MILLQVCLPPRPLLCTGDFKIKAGYSSSATCDVSDPTEREEKRGKWNGLQLIAFIFQLQISISHKLVLQKVPFATSGLCLMGN